jgi:hypothetical protein
MRKFKIVIVGFGGEVTIGSVDESQKKSLKEAGDQLTEVVVKKIDDWRSIDNQYHNWAPGETYTIQVFDESEQLVFSLNSEDIFKYDTEDFELIEYNELEIDNSLDLLMCVSFQKGVLYESRFEDEEFDIKKLKLKIDSEVGIETNYWGDMIRSVIYNGEELDTIGTSADEKEFNAYINF